MKSFLFSLVLFALAVPVNAQQSRPQLAIQIGHMARVTSFASSPNGELLASGGTDRSAKIWDAKTGKLRFSLPLQASVLAVAFPGDALLLTADSSGTLTAFDATSGALRARLEGGKREMTAAAFTRDGARAAFATTDGQIELRDVDSGQVTSNLDGHPTLILALAFSPDGRTLASCSDAFQEKTSNLELARRAGDIRLWDTRDGELIRVLRGHALAVRGLAWSGDGAKLASVGESGTAIVWNAQTFEEIEEFNASEGQGRATAVAFSPDQQDIVIGWRRGVKSFELSKANEAKWSYRSDRPIPALAGLSKGSIIAGCDDGQLRFLSTVDGKVSTTRTSLLPLTVARVSPDGKFIACADAQGTLNVWNSATGRLERCWKGHTGAASDLAFSPDGTTLISVGADKALRQWSLPQGKLLKTLADFSGPVTALALDQGGKTLAAGYSETDGNGQIKIMNLADGKELTTLAEPHGAVYSLAFTPDGSLAAACANWDSRGEFLIWNADWKLRTRQVLRGSHGVAISPDGKRLVGVGAFLDENQDYENAGDMAQLWSMRAGEMTRELTAPSPEGRALAVTFGKTAQQIWVASQDGKLRFWDGVGTAPSRALEGHFGPVNGVQIAPDGKVISAGADGTIKLWDEKTGRTIASLFIMDADAAEAKVGEQLAPEWLAVTPEGYFDGSAGAGRYVQWRVGADAFPVEAYEAAFRKPGLLKAALRGDAIDEKGVGAQFAQGRAVPPQISIVAPEAGQMASEPLKVEINASDDRNLKSLQLFVNGRMVASQPLKDAGGASNGAKPLQQWAKPLQQWAKPLQQWAKPLQQWAKPIPSGHERGWSFSLNAPLPRPDGSSGVSLKAIATDADGLQGSEEIRLLRDSRSGAFGTLHVLSIGVSKYANPAYNLNFAATDAQAFADLWKAQDGELFERTVVTTLTNANATSKAVGAAVKQIAATAGPDDVVAIFLSGHGIDANDNAFYFASHDANLDKLSDSAVSWRSFQNALGSSKARRVVLFLDACHSGKALGARQAGNDEMATQLVKNAGAIVFSSSLGDQYSYELPTIKHGAFSQAIIEGIQQGKADLDAGTGKDGTINIEELLTYLRARVPQLTDGAQMPACPLLRDFGEPFPLAKVR